MDRLKSLNVLFLEDNIEFANNTIDTLSIYFNKIHHKTNIKEALSTFHSTKIDLVLSDIKVEDGNGLDFIKSLRESDLKIPIVVLSAHKDEKFLFEAIPLHLLSYELKPLTYSNFKILLEKICRNFKITKQIEIASNIKYNFKTKELFVNSKSVRLTNKEILFMELMIDNMNSIVTNEQIQRWVWQDQNMTDAGLKNLVFRLRKKMPIDFLQNVSSVGYRLSHKS